LAGHKTRQFYSIHQAYRGPRIRDGFAIHLNMPVSYKLSYLQGGK
jgi:hypothetical protein